MIIDLYYTPDDPPCRGVLLAAKSLGVELNLIDVYEGGHMKPEFLKNCPRHYVPTLDDNGFVLAESPAIMGYLVDQYGKDDSLYPKDPKKRAMVNQRLNFDIGTLYMRHAEFHHPQILHRTAPDRHRFKQLEDAFGVLEKILEIDQWVAGSNVTIADIAIVTTVSTCSVYGFSLEKFPNICKWLENCQNTIPSYDELSREGLSKIKKYVNIVMKK